jgi:hypothetical protein
METDWMEISLNDARLEIQQHFQEQNTTELKDLFYELQ